MESRRKLKLSSNIVGRDDEIEQLRGIYRALRDDTESNDIDQTSNHRSLNFVKSSLDCPSVFVKGLSGVGKSALVEAAFRDLVNEDGAYFCEGKFDLMKTHRPFSAISDALNILCMKVARQCDKNRMEAVQAQVKELNLKEDIGLTSLLPSLQCIVRTKETDNNDMAGPSSTKENVGQSSQKNFRLFKQTVTKLIQILVGNKTLVLFIDDVQWANIDDLELIDSIIAEARPAKVLVVGGFRSEDVSPDHHLYTQLIKPKQGRAKSGFVVEIRELNLEAVNEYLSQTLQRGGEECMPLSKLVVNFTSGNIFYVRQYIDFLYKNGHIYYCLDELKWKWEGLGLLQSNVDAHESIENVLEKNIRRLGKDTIEALKLASAIGGRFDATVLDSLVKRWRATETKECPQVSYTNDVIEEILWPAVEEGLIEEVSSSSFGTDVQYKFAHDKVLSALYALTAAERDELHAVVGNCLRDLYYSPDGRPWMLIMAAESLHKVSFTFSSQDARDSMSKLNFDAAKILAGNNAFVSAATCLCNAIDLLGEDSWKRCYDSTLQTYNSSAEMEFYAGNHVPCEERVQTILKHAKTLDDQQTAYFIYVQSLSAVQMYDRALTTGLTVLRNMRLSRIPWRVSLLRMLIEVVTTTKILKKWSSEALLEREKTDDPKIELYIRLLVFSSWVAWFSGRRNEFVFLSIRAVKMSLRYGYASYTSPAFAVAAMVCGSMGNFAECDRLGETANQLMGRFPGAKDAKSITLCFYTACSYHMYNVCEPKAYLNRCLEARNVGMNGGNLAFGCTNAYLRIFFGFCNSGMRLDRLIALAAEYGDEHVSLNKTSFLICLRVVRQVAMNFAGQSKNPRILEGEEIRDSRDLSASQEPLRKRMYAWAMVYLSYMFDDYEKAKFYSVVSLKVWKLDFPVYPSLFAVVIRQMSWCKLYDISGSRRYWRFAIQDLKLVQGWVESGLVNHRSTYAMIQAETLALVKKRPLDVVEAAYEKAVSSLEEAGYILLAACSAERAGDFFVQKNRLELARDYLVRSSDLYKKIRASGKVRHLISKHPNLIPTAPE